MRRTLLMIAAVALLLTQCRKPAVELPTAGPANENMVSMTVTVGHGGKTDITDAGVITWSKNDKLYVGDGEKYIGYLTLEGTGGSATGTFSGSVSATANDYIFGFYYLGSGDYTSSLKSNPTSVDISFASQTGLIGDLDDCHIGYGTATGKVRDGNVILNSTDPVAMTSKVAIAYFEFKDGKNPYKGAITLSGDHICNSMTVGFNGSSFAGTDGTAGKGISLTDNTSSQKYVMLVPPATAVEETLNFGGGATGTTKFYKGIEANKFYCLGEGNPIEVSVKPIEFTVADPDGTPNSGDEVKVKFSSGNMYWDGDSFEFELNQYDYRTWAGKNSCIGGIVSSEGTPENNCGLFYGSSDAAIARSLSRTRGISIPMTEVIFTNNQNSSDADKPNANFTVNGQTNVWRTLSSDEWAYLIGNNGVGRSTSLRAWSDVTFRDGLTISGLIIMPDDWSGTISNTTDSATWQTLEFAGAVFLPAIGYRESDVIGRFSESGYYSGNKVMTARFQPSLEFDRPDEESDGVVMTPGNCAYGGSIRLVRSAS